MKTRLKFLMVMCLSVGVILIILVALEGCRTAEPKGEAATMVEPRVEISQKPEQKLCPIMGMDIDKSVYTEYKGKKVYFCCAGCIDKFNENPEKYVSKLPQFNQ